MNPSLQAKLAESADQFLATWPLFFGLIGLNTGAQAAQFFYSSQEFVWMHVLDLALKVAVLGVGALLLWRFLRFGRYARACNSRGTVFIGVVFLEGFLNKINLQAMAFSWFLTFFVVQGFEDWTKPGAFLFVAQDLASLPTTGFYIDLLTCCQSLSYALFFILLSRLQGEGEDA